jgi:hypothetical protein
MKLARRMAHYTIIYISSNYEVPLSVYLASEVQITQPLNDRDGDVVSQQLQILAMYDC